MRQINNKNSNIKQTTSVKDIDLTWFIKLLETATEFPLNQSVLNTVKIYWCWNVTDDAGLNRNDSYKSNNSGT